MHKSITEDAQSYSLEITFCVRHLAFASVQKLILSCASNAIAICLLCLPSCLNTQLNAMHTHLFSGDFQFILDNVGNCSLN